MLDKIILKMEAGNRDKIRSFSFCHFRVKVFSQTIEIEISVTFMVSGTIMAWQE